MRVRLIAGLLVPLALAGCSSASTLPNDVIVGPSRFSEAGKHLPVAAPVSTTCAPKQHPAHFPVERVDVGRSGSDVVVTLRVPALPTFTKTAVASIRLTGADGRHGGTFTTEWAGQNLAPDVIVADSATRQRAYIETDPVIRATSITTRFPGLLVDRLGDGWRWHLVTTVDGVRQAACAP